MDLLQLLRSEHSKKQTDRIVGYIGDDPTRFATLIDLFFKGEYRITQRAAWPLSYCVRAHPALIGPYFKSLLDNLARKDIHVAVIRNTVRLLQDVDIPKKYHGRVMSTCFEFIQSPETPIAVKGFFADHTGQPLLPLSRDPRRINTDHRRTMGACDGRLPQQGKKDPEERVDLIQ